MKDSERFIDALITGNELIIKELYTKLFPKIKSYVMKNRGDSQDASDVFHDGLMYIIVTQKEKRSEIKSFEAYLFVVCKNLWLKTLKNKVIKTDTLTLVDKEEELSSFIIEQQLFDFYIEIFDLLSENCKEVLSSYFNGLTYEEIVIEYAYASVNTVRQRVFKCRTKLIKLIKEDNKYQKIKQWRQN
ncbi:sigma-70 family RNA polymerase sigma factor [Kordia sp. YSTF-M3]|uniref:Sigma-70 family RNA polymerase sigma factor n=1 Tax=Kordia aestuariivivens TaxID=2759037 RepID=A0ABR7Q7S2_9FLAO|nr:sigma-70 family RNA polymerase sigma factor [Kordia aestuariivivens]MBC8754617.1 sigma-70 family RNA polymerase sigma factor [Kordia aestuariivivens]